MKPNQVVRLSLMLIVSFFLITGCNQQTGGGGISVNEDSVRAHILPIKEAIEYTTRFRSTRDTFYRQVPILEHALNLGRAEAFNRDAVAILLNQKDSSGAEAAGIRIYYGLDQGGQVRMVLVPYDAHGNDIINQLITNKAVHIPGIRSANAFSSEGQTVENGQRCPTLCANGSSGL
ncbi:MAG: hypothetical protein C5B59_14845 [Bacteroidetes bacterium]|nr:MAG: hypothetical protein C5B59_14845 [Bacteroidota bacterium]